MIKDITEKFDFNVPSEIDWETKDFYKKGFGVSAGVTAVGAISSFCVKSVVPFCISVAPLIAILMVYILKETDKKSKNSCLEIVTRYLGRVKKEILAMIFQIQEYYDAEVEKFESELK